MPNNEIKIRISLEDEASKGIKILKAETEGFENVVKSTTESLNNIKATTIDWASTSIVVGGMTNAIGQLKSIMDELSNAYAIQEQAETKLSTIMSQRMNASDAEVQSIKNLASAQQELADTPIKIVLY